MFARRLGENRIHSPAGIFAWPPSSLIENANVFEFDALLPVSFSSKWQDISQSFLEI